MELTKTNRGFGIVKFKELYGHECSLQKSSLATQDAVWLGCSELVVQELRAGHGWVDVPIPETSVANNRMHLTREQVAELLPYLQKFVETGELE